MFLLDTHLDLICTLIWPHFYGYRHCGTREGGLNMLKYLSPVCAKLSIPTIEIYGVVSWQFHSCFPQNFRARCT